MDIREQLAHLRQTIGNIDARYAVRDSPHVRAASALTSGQTRGLIEDLVSGEVVFTPYGSHFETEQFFAANHRHGSYEISDLASLAPDLLSALSDGAIASSPPERWLFLDTETTGLAGGSGTYAFLVGVGSIGEEGFRVR